MVCANAYDIVAKLEVLFADTLYTYIHVLLTIKGQHLYTGSNVYVPF